MKINKCVSEFREKCRLRKIKSRLKAAFKKIGAEK
jgi:hypothetical protein